MQSARKGATMKNTFMVIPSVFLICFVVGCQQGERVRVEPVADVQAGIQAIRNVAEKWEAAINSGDIDTIMSFYSEDAVKIPPNEPRVLGKEAIRDGYQKLFEKYTHKEDHVVTDIKVNGDLAFTNTTWSLIATPKDGGESTKHRGNWIRIFGQQPDGSWKVIYMMWSDESLVSPTHAE
jgi:uncharacterized protein (TIGR02246 family)